MLEHYNITISCYAIDSVTSKISKKAKQFNSTAPENIRPADTLISQVDGSMLPIVDTTDKDGVKSSDKRKHRKYYWKELRVSTVREPSSADTYYGVALGEPFTIGCMIYESCQFKGLDTGTYVHVVSDGARWIANQYEIHFGQQHTFLLDFFHACEYLSEASHSLAEDESKIWFKEQKEHLLESKADEVLENLNEIKSNMLEKNSDSTEVSKTINYLQDRHQKGQLDYQSARAQDLPIGSGEVESAHRHILQQRLKIPGAWWKLERAEEMAQLKAMRANNRWNEFWNKQAA